MCIFWLLLVWLLACVASVALGFRWFLWVSTLVASATWLWVGLVFDGLLLDLDGQVLITLFLHVIAFCQLGTYCSLLLEGGAVPSPQPPPAQQSQVNQAY